MNYVRTLHASAVIRLIIAAALLMLLTFAIAFTLARNAAGSAIVNTACGTGQTCVYLKGDHAAPDVVTVPVGGFVQFNSADGKTHSLGLGKGDAKHNGSHQHEGLYTSGDFKNDEAWRVQFKERGTYELHDHYRPDIRVTVVVYEPNRNYMIN